MDHDFSGPTIYDPADFVPRKQCKICGYAIDESVLMPYVTSGTSYPGRCPAGGPKSAMNVVGRSVMSSDLTDLLKKQIKDDLEKLVQLNKSSCECGSSKALGVGKGQPGHSSWCPWYKDS